MFGIMNIKILVCCHKNDIFKSSDVYLPIQVGRAISNTILNMQGDNEGLNISEKNDCYCELTGMYWAWKNLKGVDYIGLCHYRRYFDFNHIGRKVFPLTTIGTKLFDSLNLDINSNIKSYLERGACIVAKPVHLHTSLYLQYCEGHYSPDFRVMGDVIRETSSPEYVQGFWKYLVESNKFSPYNMFIMSWKQFGEDVLVLIVGFEWGEKRIYFLVGLLVADVQCAAVVGVFVVDVGWEYRRVVL